MHPHNANPELYKQAEAHAWQSYRSAFELDETLYKIIFSTIESSDARVEAIEVQKRMSEIRVLTATVLEMVQQMNRNAESRNESVSKS